MYAPLRIPLRPLLGIWEQSADIRSNGILKMACMSKWHLERVYKGKRRLESDLERLCPIILTFYANKII